MLTQLRAAVACSAICLAALVTLPAYAQDRTLHEFDLPEQPLPEALRTIARQTGANVLFEAKDLDGIRAPALRAHLTIAEAIKQVLAGTKLRAEQATPTTLIVRPATTVSGTDERVTQPGGNAQPAGDLQGSRGPDESISASHPLAAEPERAGADQARSPQRTEVEEIVVTGTHIRGAAQLSMPTMTFTRTDIEKAGYATVEELFRSLPQNLADIGPMVGEGASSVATDNSDRATGIDLRGLGPQSTLVLLNGKRRAGSVQGRAVDISAIPLAVIERVEVVTGGRSAIYGSDAVAGVVNFVTRHDFEGAESQAYYGTADAGYDRWQLSQIVGRRFARGGFVAAYDYSDNSSLDATRAGIVGLPSRYGIVPAPGDFDLLPDGTRHSGFLAGRYLISERLELHAEGLYTVDRDEHLLSYGGDGYEYFNSSRGTSTEYSFAPGMALDLDGNWQLDISGVQGRARNEDSSESTDGSRYSSVTTSLSSIAAVLDGIVLSGDRFEVRAAIGAETREENMESGRFAIDTDRRVSSAFTEALIALAPTRSGLHRLQLSIAARHSDYSDFGSSFDPQFGLVWNASRSLTVRGSYSTAFRAPDLFSLNESFGAVAILIDQEDPTQGNALVPTLIWNGKNSRLEPEEAATWSLGIDYRLAAETELSLSYFDIRYDERIDEPTSGDDEFLALSQESRYPGLIVRAPAAEQLDQIVQLTHANGTFGNNTGTAFDPASQSLLDVFPNVVLFDNRIHNIAAERLRGVDLAFESTVATRRGEITLAVNGTYYLQLDRRLTPSSAYFSQLNGPSKPVDFKIRASAGWERAALGWFTHVNYVDHYEDTLITPSLRIGSWTTIDTTLRLEGSAIRERGVWHGLTATLSIRNLFDREPPTLLSNTFGIAYDPANADALGRFVSLSLLKRW